jgi:hypothetical protein
MATTYQISVDVGTVSNLNTLDGTFSYTAPAVAGPAVLTINGNVYNLTINPALTNTPTIIVPQNGSIVSCNTVLVSATAFSNTGPADTQLSANWQLATDLGFTNIVQQSLNDTVNLNSYLFKNLSLNTTYYVRVSYAGHTSLASPYSAVTPFTTGAVCYPSEEIYENVSANIQNYGQYGQAVATPLDGTTLVVSAPSETSVNNYNKIGNVYVYDTTAFPYTLLQTIYSSDANSGSFGSSVELSSNGDFLFIGDPLSASLLNPSIYNSGVVYVYQRVNGTYTLLGTIEPSVPANGFYFGQYVKMSQDMSTLVISSYSSFSTPAAASIFVYDFNSSAGTWSLSTSFTDTLVSTTTSDGYYGSVIDINATGTTIVTSSSSNNGGYGVVFVYTKTNGVWSVEQILPDQTKVGVYSGFGDTLALSADGTKLFVGASANNVTVNGSTYTSQGEIFYYAYSSGSWVLKQIIDSPVNQSYSNFGYCVKISPDGTMLAVIGSEIYIYTINTNAEFTYIATLNSIVSNAGNWVFYSSYGYGSGVPNQCMALNNANNRLYIGNTNVSSNTYYSNGIVYTFSCFQNPSLIPSAV